MEGELSKLNATQIPSTREFSTYLMGMNKMIKNMAANEDKDKNLTQQLNVALGKIDELQNTLLNQSTEMEHYK